MKKIPLGHDKYALVDDADFDELNKVRWKISTWGYAQRNAPQKNYVRQGIPTMMHRIILNAKLGERCDHISGDKLDNRRSNLRIATPQQNGFNRGANRNNKSGLKGVSWDKGTRKWRARMMIRGHNFHFGLFDNKHKAHAAYFAAAKKLHGEFAHP